MEEKEYRLSEGISRSELWKIRESPEKFIYFKNHPEEPTPALIFGQAFHKLALEPDKFTEEFAVAPAVDRRTKDGKEEWARFVEESENKTVISREFYEKANEMTKALYSIPLAAKLLSGDHEKAFFWDDDLTGERCKSRVDCVRELNGVPVIVDLKTTADATNEAFTRDALRYGYDLQAAMYSEGVKANTGKTPIFVFISIEKEPPYSVNIMQADELFVKRGYDIFRELIGIYHDCKTSGNWYGYLGKYSVINNLSLPAWAAKDIE